MGDQEEYDLYSDTFEEYEYIFMFIRWLPTDYHWNGYVVLPKGHLLKHSHPLLTDKVKEELINNLSGMNFEVDFWDTLNVPQYPAFHNKEVVGFGLYHRDDNGGTPIVAMSNCKEIIKGLKRIQKNKDIIEIITG